ncbi:phage tail protein [Pantoea sp.]|uniref:phage tail protein n=1 Tax=Pantoea sp. TaxID=69393 RepID=UPI0031D710EB
MADEPLKVTVQASRIDASILPPGFSLPYRLYVIQQQSDMKAIADGANNASELAYQATIKNEEQDTVLADHEGRITQLRIEVDNHELRITANTGAISLLDVRLTSAEGKITVLRSDVNYLLDEVIDIQSDMVSKSSTANQSVQSGGGALLVGNITTPTADILQVAGSENVSVSYKVAGLKVVGARQTGWTAATGTAFKSAFNADNGYQISGTYQQFEAISVANGLTEARQRIKALEDALRTHGLIN